MGEAPPVFLIQLAPAEPEQSAKGLQMAKKNCGACGLFIDEQEQDTKGFHLPKLCDANDEAFDYEGTISFTTDKQLTQEQLNQLMDIIILQIAEPVDENQEDEDYSTRNVEVTVKEVK
jgi:hypothetical protein